MKLYTNLTPYYVGWLSERNEMPTEDNADLFFEETEASFESSLLYNN